MRRGILFLKLLIKSGCITKCKKISPPYPPKGDKNYKKSTIKSPSGGFRGLCMNKSKVSLIKCYCLAYVILSDPE